MPGRPHSAADGSEDGETADEEPSVDEVTAADDEAAGDDAAVDEAEADGAAGDDAAVERVGNGPELAEVPGLPMPALAAAAVSAVALSVAPIVGVVDGRDPAFLSWPLLALLAVLPVALAAFLSWRNRPAMAAGVLAGFAVLAPGRALVDLQFAADASVATRPELAVPGATAVGPAWFGLVLLLLGHVAAVVAGVLAMRASAALPDDGRITGGGREIPVTVVAAALVLAAGLLLQPYVSSEANLLDRAALNGPMLVVLGVLLTGVCAVVAAALAMVTQAWGLASGMLTGIALAAASIALPSLVAATARPWLHVAAGPFVVLIAAGVLVAVPPAFSALEARAERRVSGPGLRWLYPLTGLFALAAAACAYAGARNPIVHTQLSGAFGITDVQAWLFPAGALLAVLGVGLLVPRLAPVVRPAFGVAWVALVLAAAPVLSRAVSAGEVLAGTSVGGGAVYPALGVAAATFGAGSAAIAGALERDGMPVGPGALSLKWPAAVAAVLAVGAFVFPVADGPMYRGGSLLHGFDVTAGGTLLTLAVVLGGLLVVPMSRPLRAAAVIAGLLGVLLIRLLEPVVVTTGAGKGVWFASGCALVMVVMLVMAVRPARR